MTMTARDRQNARIAALRTSLGYQPPAPSTRKPKGSAASAAYWTDHGVLILPVGHPPGSAAMTDLKMHEARSSHDLTPLCGQPLDPWEGLPVEYTDQGRNLVTCERCWRCTGETS